MSDRWWVCTDALARGGNKVIGPFESQDLALQVRAYVEVALTPRTFWVDAEPEEEQP